MNNLSSHVGLLLLLVSAVCGRRCSNSVPGLNWQRRGVDVTRLDLMPVDVAAYEDGYMSPVIDLTCDQNLTYKIAGVTYSLPDQVWVVSDLPSGSLLSTQTTMTTTQEARNSFAVNAGIEVDVAFFAFSASTSYSKTQKTILKQSKKVLSVSASYSARRMEFKHVDALALGEDAARELRSLPSTYAANTTGYEKFIKQFGTHYVAEGRFGGVMMMYMETDSSYYEESTEESLSVQASASFYSVLTIKGGVDTSSTKVDSEFSSKTSKTVRYFGGTWNIMEKDGLEAWQPTIDKLPWMYSTKLRRISELIRDSSRKAAMDQAIDDYLRRQYISLELPRVLDVIPAEGQSRSEVSSLRNRISIMKTKYPLVLSEVLALEGDVYKVFSDVFIKLDRAAWTTPSEGDATIKVVCPAGKTVAGVKSWYSHTHRDRQFQIFCRYVPRLQPLTNCRWAGYNNEMHEFLNVSCPGNGAIKMWFSYHQNWAEDRVYSFRCCDLKGLGQPKCEWTPYLNSLTHSMTADYSNTNKVIRGVMAEYSNRDRRYRLEVCDWW